MKKWNLIIDVAKCHNCNNCFLACKDEYVGNSFPGYSVAQPLHGHKWFHVESRERGQMPMVDVAFRPTTCNHCKNAPCVEQSKDGSVYQREDGIVMIDPDSARGQDEIVASCPYGAIWWNEESRVAQKWSFDAHLLDRGQSRLRCEQVCPTGVFRSLKVEDSDMERICAEEDLQVLHPELGTKPRVYYKNLDRFTKHFIGGTLIANIGEKLESATGVEVVLVKDGDRIESAISDEYGDFKLDGLDGHSGSYTVQFHSPDYGHGEINVELEESINLGTISLNERPSDPPFRSER